MRRIATAVVAAAAWAVTGTAPVQATPIDLTVPDWRVDYMIDQSQTVLEFDQAQLPRNGRGLALSADGLFLYAGYNSSGVGAEAWHVGEVRKIELAKLSDTGSRKVDYGAATVARRQGPTGKAIAVDDVGRVYLAEGSSIEVYDANLSELLHSIPATRVEGVDVVREGTQLALYAADRTAGTLSRYVLDEAGPTITGHTRAGFAGGTGQIAIAGANANGLRNVGVDPATGRIWLTDVGNTAGAGQPTGGQVFSMAADGTDLRALALDQAFDLGFDDGQVLVSQYYLNTISVLTPELALSSSFALPATLLGLELDPTGQSGVGALAGLAVWPGHGMWVANEAGETAGERSTYGLWDDQAGEVAGGGFFADMFHDDNEPILFIHAPEPGSLVLLLAGGVVGLRRRSRRA